MWLLFLPVLHKQRPTPEVHWPSAYSWGLVKADTVVHLQVQCFYKPGKEVLCQKNDADLQTKIKPTIKCPAISYFTEQYNFTPFLN